MSREESLFEAMGGTYRSVDGILYPNIDVDVMHFGMDSAITTYDIGKYGHLWISYMKENHPDRYRYHIRLGQLQIKAKEVNEEAYEMLDRIVERYLAKHKPKDKRKMRYRRLNAKFQRWRTVIFYQFTDDKCLEQVF